MTIPESLLNFKGDIHSTYSLPKVRLVDADFEDIDGSPLTLSSDLLNHSRIDMATLGPIQQLRVGKNHILLWEKDNNTKNSID